MSLYSQVQSGQSALQSIADLKQARQDRKNQEEKERL